jgi:hypothetical protein
MATNEHTAAAASKKGAHRKPQARHDPPAFLSDFDDEQLRPGTNSSARSSNPRLMDCPRKFVTAAATRENLCRNFLTQRPMAAISSFSR